MGSYSYTYHLPMCRVLSKLEVEVDQLLPSSYCLKDSSSIKPVSKIWCLCLFSSVTCFAGIWAGMRTVRYFDGKTYKWVGLSRQPNIIGKVSLAFISTYFRSYIQLCMAIVSGLRGNTELVLFIYQLSSFSGTSRVALKGFHHTTRPKI